MKRSLWILLVLIVVAAGATAQTTTATIHGKVQNDRGDNIAKAEINAVSTQSGFVKTVTSGGDGAYLLNGLTPGEYQIVVAAPGFEPRNETLTVLVGQNLEMNLRLTPTAVLSESITVVGNQAVEIKTSEVATNVTTQQIESLPQDDRNFLHFAALAPGIRLSGDPQSKTFAGDAQDAEQTNIFIDGVSTKNDVLLGGTSGQNSSRGNPFPQSAVQEFRVITQNYGAQYDHASSAIITAVTKSGGNQFTGQAFAFYQPKAWVAPLKVNYGYSGLATNKSYHRLQPGISLGGPIIKDKFNFFFAYEGDDEHATTTVPIPAAFQSQFGQYAGVFPSPFKSTNAFGKLSWQLMANNILEGSVNYRREHETRDFGANYGNAAFQHASDYHNWVYGGTLRDLWNGANTLNEASLALQKYGWNPRPLNPDLVGRNYFGCCILGGYNSPQDFNQRRLELRDNFNLAPMTAMGIHNFQVGGNIEFMHYNIVKNQLQNPEFRFKNDPQNGFSFAQPFEVGIGFGNPSVVSSNNEYGIYGQDKWAVNNNLQLDLGVRWDYETHMIDNNYVTPAAIVAGLKGKTFTNDLGQPFTIPDSYFSTGTERKPYKNEIQPRLGFSYDIFGNAKSVVSGGWGRFYDRLFQNSTFDEQYRQQWPVYNIEFSPDGRPGTIQWSDSLFNVDALKALIASGKASPEIYMLNNNTKPPYSNAWNVAFKQALGSWIGSAGYNVVRGYRGITYVSPTGTCCRPLAPGFGNVIINDVAGKSFWYTGESLTLERPFNKQTRWGLRVLYNHSKALQNGNDLFSLDLPSAASFPRHPIPGSEPNHIFASGIFGLPWDLRFSTNVTLGTGPAVILLDLSQGFDLAGKLKTGVIPSALYPGRPCSGCPSGKTLGFGYRDVDTRLEKDFPTFGRTSVGLVLEVFNVFNWTNYGCLNNFIGPPPPGDRSSIGIGNCSVTLGRREQVGLKLNY